VTSATLSCTIKANNKLFWIGAWFEGLLSLERIPTFRHSFRDSAESMAKKVLNRLVICVDGSEYDENGTLGQHILFFVRLLA
jgi:hypothetical protein